MQKYKIKTYAEAINDALHESLEKDKNLICYGLRVGDQKKYLIQPKIYKKSFLKKSFRCSSI